MPAAKSKLIGKDGMRFTKEFTAMQDAARALGNKADCAVKCVALLTDTPYERVDEFMRKAGRTPKRGTAWHIIWAAFDHFGYKAVEVPAIAMIAQYPRAHQVLRSLTTHHPERFHNVWRNGNRYMLNTTSHVVAVINGVNHDWTMGKAKRVKRLFQIIKKDTVQ